MSLSSPTCSHPSIVTPISLGLFVFSSIAQTGISLPKLLQHLIPSPFHPKSPMTMVTLHYLCLSRTHARVNIPLGSSLSTLCLLPRAPQGEPQITSSSHIEGPPRLASTASSSSASFLALQTLSLEKKNKKCVAPHMFYVQCLCLCSSFSPR